MKSDDVIQNPILNQFFSEEMVGQLRDAGQIQEQTLKKGELLCEAGARHHDIYFIKNGSLRQFGIKNGEEVNFLFYFEEEFVFDETSFYSQLPSNYYFQALERTEVLRIDRSLFEFDQRAAKYTEFLFHLSRTNVLKLYKRNEVLLMDTPEERYLKLLEVHPKIIENISLAKIASFIGIAPPSLSRIRKRLVKR